MSLTAPGINEAYFILGPLSILLCGEASCASGSLLPDYGSHKGYADFTASSLLYDLAKMQLIPQTSALLPQDTQGFLLISFKKFDLVLWKQLVCF